MKRKIFSILSILLIVTLLSSVFPLGVFAQDRIGKVTGNNVNVRKGPGTQYARIANLSADQFVTIIDEKDNSIVITERGLQELTTDFNDIDANFFITPNVGEKVAEINEKPISEKDKEEQINNVKDDFYIKSERIHTVNQLLKAYALFEKDVEYVIIENKIKIVDEQTGVSWRRRYSDGRNQHLKRKNVKVEHDSNLRHITLQSYFRCTKACGYTGQAETEPRIWESTT